MKLYRDRDGQPVRETAPGQTEIMLPDGTWKPYRVDTYHDAAPLTVKAFEACVKDWVAPGVKADPKEWAAAAA